MEIYRIGPKLELMQGPLAPGDRALVLLTTQEMEHPPQLTGLENVIRHIPSAQGARGCRVEARRGCLSGTVITPRHTRAGLPIAFGFFLTADLLVLCDDSEAIPALVHRLSKEGRWQENGPGRLLCQLLELLLSKDTHHMEELEDQLSQLEEQVLSGRLDQFTAPISGLRRELMHWSRYFSQLGNVADTLEEDDWGLFTEEESRLFHMLSRRLGRLRDDSQLLREYCLQVRELFQTQVDLRQNKIMKTLTLVTTLCLPLSLVAAWYGMNFTGMPELSWKYGYPAVIAASVLIVIACLWIMKRKKLW